MNNNERLYEAIEESARTKKPIRLNMQEGDTLKMVMISNTRFLVDDLFCRDDRDNIYRAMVEAYFENRRGLILPGMYVCGNNCIDGTGSGRTTMFRKENRYQTLL